MMSGADRNRQSATRRRLPPFGRELVEMRKAGLVPGNNTVVVSLDSWDWGKAYARVVVPPEIDPSQLDFCFVAGLDVVVVCDPSRTPLERRDALARAILPYQPTTLRVVLMGDPVQWIWIKSRAVGVELDKFK